MLFRHVILESAAYALAPKTLSSEEIEQRLEPLYKRLNLPFGRLELMTGILERRCWNEGTTPSEASAQAGEAVLAKTGLPREQLDLLIHAAVCRDRLEPATAAYVHRRLGLSPHTQIFDLSNACLGFLNAIVVAGGLIDSGQIRSALIVAGENGGPLLENTIRELLRGHHTRQSIKPFFANLTIGSGCVAAVLCHESMTGRRSRLVGGAGESGTEHNNLCEGDASSLSSLEMQTDSEELLTAGLGVAERTWKRFRDETGWTAETPDCFVCHQVGAAHRRQLYERLQLDPGKDFSTFDRFGNMGSVSLPFTLVRAAECGAVRNGNRVALLGIGSGISSLMLALEW